MTELLNLLFGFLRSFVRRDTELLLENLALRASGRALDAIQIRHRPEPLAKLQLGLDQQCGDVCLIPLH